MPFLARVFQSAAAWAFLGTFLRLGANVLVLPLILRRLPTEQLGLWYVFGALGGFATLLDFGFEATVARTTAYAWGGAKRLAAFGFHEEPPHEDGPNKPLFSDLLATLQAYYRSLGLLVLVLLTVAGGWWVWHKTLGMPQANSILLAWMVYAIGSCLNFVSGRWPALLTGIGALRTANQIGIIGMLVYYVVSVAGLLAGWGIWSLVAGTFLMGLVSRTIGRIVFSRLAALPGGLPAPHFHREIFSAIWPNAWRTGLVSLGAYLIVQANTLICSAFLGLITTASYGLSFQMVMILSGVSAVWVQVKLPEINQLRVPGDYRRIAVLFTTRIRLTILTYFLGAVTLIFAGPQILALIGSKTALLPSPLLILLCVIQFLEMHHSQYGGLVLSENHNPFIIPALLSGGVIVLGSFILAPIFGVYGLLLSAGIVQLAFNNWWTVFRGISGLRMSAASYWWLFFTGKVEKI